MGLSMLFYNYQLPKVFMEKVSPEARFKSIKGVMCAKGSQQSIPDAGARESKKSSQTCLIYDTGRSLA